jgi:hypothetical protein
LDELCDARFSGEIVGAYAYRKGESRRQFVAPYASACSRALNST